MTREEAMDILLLYRPGSGDDHDADVKAALQLTEGDPRLKQWFEEHCAFQKAVRSKLRSLPVPADLKQSILASQKIIEPVAWWRSPVALAAAAMIVLLLALAPLLKPRSSENRFSDFASKMSGTVQREYRMDVESSDLRAVRNYMASRGSPADFEVPQELQNIELAGGGFLRWRNQPVSMVCFRKADQEMVYLFVLNSAAVVDPPPETPVRADQRGLPTKAWKRGDRIYLLANLPESQ